jgi:hypothetical protein
MINVSCQIAIENKTPERLSIPAPSQASLGLGENRREMHGLLQRADDTEAYSPN